MPDSPRDNQPPTDPKIIEGIRQGLEEMNAGRGRPADEVFEEIRREFELPSEE